MKKIVVFLLALLLFFTSIPMSVNADEYFDPSWCQDYLSSITGNGGGATNSVPKGVVNSQQGWLIYVIDKYGNVLTPAYGCVKSGGYITAEACEYRELDPRYGGGFSGFKSGYEWPDATVGDSFSSNYSAVKSYMTSNKGDNLLHVLKYYFGDATRDMFLTDEDYYFVMEPIYWHGLHRRATGSSGSIGTVTEDSYKEYIKEKTMILMPYKRFVEEGNTIFRNWAEAISSPDFNDVRKNVYMPYINGYVNRYCARYPFNPADFRSGSTTGFEWIGKCFCGTVYQGARWIQGQSEDFFIGVDICRRNYWPNNIKYSKDIAGVPAGGSGGYIGDVNILHAGYGICAFWNKEIVDPEPEEYEADKLYETRNWSDVFDISKAIPSSEFVNNEIDCSSLVTEENFFDNREELWEDKYSTTVKYYWEEEIITIVPQSWEYLASYPTLTEAREAEKDYHDQGKIVKIENESGMYNIYENVPEHEVSNTVRHDINSRDYKFSGKLHYQYICDSPQIYFWDNTEIGNGAFPDGVKEHTLSYFKEDVDELPEAYAMMRLWNMGNGSPTEKDTALNETDAGVIYRYSKDHFIWKAGNVSYMGDECVKKVTHYDTEPCDYSNARAELDCNSFEISVTQKYAKQIQDGTRSRNDYLKMTAPLIGTVELVTDDWWKGCTVKVKRNGLEIAEFPGDDASAHGYRQHGILYRIMNDFLAARVKGEKEVQIPADTDNGDYPTGMHVSYHYIFRPAEIGKEYFAGKEYYADTPIPAGVELEEIYEHVMEGGVLPHHVPGDGYPIRVHTPVESPVRVTYYDGVRAYEDNQLVPSATNFGAEYELLLDKKYFVEWDDTRWFSAIYGDCEGYENIYNKYVKAKYLKFPFSIVYKDVLYNVGEDGYTGWIEIEEPANKMQSYRDGVDWQNYESANHWQMTPFYIPTYSEERGAWDDNAFICAKVEAINVEGRYAGDHSDAQENIINSDKENYVAVFDAQIQVSGWIYDFTIVGADNRFLYKGGEFTDFYNNWYAMCPERQELKAGTKNRVGTDWIRFAESGFIWKPLKERQCLPLKNGYSYAYSEMGDLWRSERFAFTLKTIADLNGKNDSVEITPSYRYVLPDGEVYDTRNGDFCYVKLSDDWLSWYVYDKTDMDVEEVLEDKPFAVFDYQLSDPMFNESYYNETEKEDGFHFGDWVTTSVNNENTYNPLGVTNQQYQDRKIKNYTISHISLKDKARYISGEYEQLEINNDKMYGDVLPYTFAGHDENKFIHSMQQWNGEFQIPSRIRLIDTKGEYDFDFEEWLDEIGQWSWNDYDLFMPFKANSEMVIHFDIVAYKDGKPYLQYDGSGFGGKNMWEVEGYIDDPPVNPDPLMPEVPIEPGDIAIVDWQRQIGDFYEVGIFNIN